MLLKGYLYLRGALYEYHRDTLPWRIPFPFPGLDYSFVDKTYFRHDFSFLFRKNLKGVCRCLGVKQESDTGRPNYSVSVTLANLIGILVSFAATGRVTGPPFRSDMKILPEFIQGVTHGDGGHDPSLSF